MTLNNNTIYTIHMPHIKLLILLKEIIVSTSLRKEGRRDECTIDIIPPPPFLRKLQYNLTGNLGLQDFDASCSNTVTTFARCQVFNVEI